MNELQRDYGERGLHIVGINLDEDADSAQRFLSAHPAHFSVAADRSSQCPRAFAVTAMPTAYLIDRRGIVRHVFVGFKAGGEAVIRQEIEHMLADTTDKN
jgi:peroxiredoxin